MSSGEPSGKKWRPSLRAEDLARFAEKARDLDMKFLDREGEPMSPDEWIEAKTDPSYLVVAVDRIENVEVITSWIGVHFEDNPTWQRVIFGTQVVILHPEDIERMAGPLPDPAELLQPAEESFDLLSILDPVFGDLVSRHAWHKLAEAKAGHRLIADGLRKQLGAEDEGGG